MSDSIDGASDATTKTKTLLLRKGPQIVLRDDNLYEKAWEFFLVSLHDFIDRDRDLIETAASERSLCARLMLSMEMQKQRHGFEYYVADIEYNRINQGDVKRLHADGGAITVDLVVHRRTTADNLIALEMKWFSATQTYERQKANNYERLRTVTMVDDRRGSLPRGYVLGLYLEVRRQERLICSERFREGTCLDDPVLTVF